MGSVNLSSLSHATFLSFSYKAVLSQRTATSLFISFRGSSKSFMELIRYEENAIFQNSGLLASQTQSLYRLRNSSEVTAVLFPTKLCSIYVNIKKKNTKLISVQG